ncbi:MAG: FecR family protein [Thermodesulfobacteriota bacterium]
MRLRFLTASVLIMVLILMLPLGVKAAVVGHLTQVEGQVELMRQGKLPFLPAKLKDGVEPGDLIRTKSASRAQVRFIDDSVLNIAPGSRVGIEDYLYDAGKGSRRAVLQVFQGLVHCLVQRLFNVEQPDFIMKTHTATLGVRGTSWYNLIGVNFIHVFGERGMLQVSSLPGAVPGTVVLIGQEQTQVKAGLAPTQPRRYPLQTLGLLQDWMRHGVPPRIISGGPIEMPRVEGGARTITIPDRPGQIQERMYIPPALPPHLEPPGPQPTPTPGSGGRKISLPGSG